MAGSLAFSAARRKTTVAAKPYGCAAVLERAKECKCAQIMDGVERDRLAALRRYKILDTPPDGSFDRVTALAAKLMRTPIALVSLVDEHRIWFKSTHGLAVREVPRTLGLCASAMLKDEPYVLPDATLDPNALSNPLLAADFGLRFYCGAPLRTRDGHGLGTLCVIDRQPRQTTCEELETLSDLAGIVMDEMELRLSAARAIEAVERAGDSRETLLKEVHHRVKNNLQMIASMVSLRARSLKGSPQAWSQFTEVLTRIQTVSRLHEMIYASENATEVDVCECIRSVADLVLEAHSVHRRVRVTCTGAGPSVGLDQGVPLALLMAEVLSNASVHAFPDARTGRIDLRVSGDGREIVVTARDDGVGLGDGVGTGLRLLDLLARQLRGQYSLGAGENGGTDFRLVFPT